MMPAKPVPTSFSDSFTDYNNEHKPCRLHHATRRHPRYSFATSSRPRLWSRRLNTMTLSLSSTHVALCSTQNSCTTRSSTHTNPSKQRHTLRTRLELSISFARLTLLAMRSLLVSLLLFLCGS